VELRTSSNQSAGVLRYQQVPHAAELCLADAIATGARQSVAIVRGRARRAASAVRIAGRAGVFAGLQGQASSRPVLRRPRAFRYQSANTRAIDSML